MFGIACSISMFSIPITINGSTNVTSGQVYSYNAIGGMPSSNGIKAKWTVTNGYFNTGDGTKPTTLNQDADFTSVDVVWTTAGIGFLTYYYKNGSSAAYEGNISVTISSNSSGGTGGENPGSGTGENNRPIVKIGLLGPDTVMVGETVTFYPEDINSYQNFEKSWWWGLEDYEKKGICEILEKTKDHLVLKFLKESKDSNRGRINIQYQADFKNVTVVASKPVFIDEPKLNSTNLSNSIICNNEEISFTITSTRNYPVKWEAISNLTIIEGQGSNIAKFKASGNGVAKIRATINNIYTLENSSDVWVGAPKMASVNSPGYLCVNQSSSIDKNSVSVNFEGRPDGRYKWTKGTNNFRFIGLVGDYGGNEIAVVPSIKGAMIINCEATNRCGSTLQVIGIEAENCKPSGGGGFNPTSINTNKSLGTIPYEDIRIFSFSTGQTVYQEKKTVNFSIENTTLKPGIYIIESTDENGNITRAKVMKK